MAPVALPNFNKWRKPPTSVYEDNYGYGINFYQPMIDYIAAKEQGINTKPPELPWNNERGLEKYRFDKPITAYTDEEVSRLSHEISEQAKRDLNNFSIAKRSPFSVIATADAANVVKHVESVSSESSNKKIEKKRVKYDRQKQRMNEFLKEIESIESEANTAAELKKKAKTYRGKSANAIAHTLLKESLEKVQRSQDLKIKSELNMSQGDASVQSRRIVVKNVSGNFRETYSDTNFLFDDSYLQPLNDLKNTIKKFENLNTSILVTNRYVHALKH